jgi:hypothetical protein
MTPTSPQVLPWEEPTPRKPILARRGAIHGVKRRKASVRAGRLSPEMVIFGRADGVDTAGEATVAVRQTWAWTDHSPRGRGVGRARI